MPVPAEIRRALKIWGALVISGVLAFSAVAYIGVMNNIVSGEVSVECNVHLGPSVNPTSYSLFIDGKEVETERGYDSNYGKWVHFESVPVRAGKTHRAWVTDDIGHTSTVEEFSVKYQDYAHLQIYLGNVSTVGIGVSFPSPSQGQNEIVSLYIDGAPSDTTTGNGYAYFTQYLDKDRTYLFEAKVGSKSASQSAYVDNYTFTVYLQID